MVITFAASRKLLNLCFFVRWMDKILKGMQNKAAPIAELLNEKMRDYPTQCFYWYGTQGWCKTLCGGWLCCRRANPRYHSSSGRIKRQFQLGDGVLDRFTPQNIQYDQTETECIYTYNQAGLLCRGSSGVKLKCERAASSLQGPRTGEKLPALPERRDWLTPIQLVRGVKAKNMSALFKNHTYIKIRQSHVYVRGIKLN